MDELAGTDWRREGGPPSRHPRARLEQRPAYPDDALRRRPHGQRLADGQAKVRANKTVRVMRLSSAVKSVKVKLAK
jgi:hypothetical protein